MPCWQDEKGFTLVELCVVVVVGSLIFLLIYGVLQTQWRHRRFIASESQMQKEAAVVLMRIAEDIREASESQINITGGCRLAISDRQYYIENGNLYFSNGEKRKILARQVITQENGEKAQPTFAYQAEPGLIYINLMFKGKKDTYSLQQAVKPRR